MIPAILALLALTSAGHDLLLIEGDLRQTSMPEDAEVLYVSQDWFIATGDPEMLDATSIILEAGPVDLQEFALVHLRTPDDTGSASAVGEVLFCRGRTALVRVSFPEGVPRAFQGVHLVEPLRAYDEGAVQPFRPALLNDPAITDIVEAVDQDSIIATIQHYEDYQTRLCITDNFYDSCVWTRDKLQSYGLSSEIEEFDFTFYGTPYTSWNVIAEQPGMIQPEIIVIICGHLDSITMSNPYETAPGADDNGSGSATVVEAARILSDLNFRYTVRYICFGAEELGLIGSDFYAQEAAANGDSIIAVMNLDMILYAPDSLRQLFVPYNAISEELAMNMQSITDLYVPELELNVQYSPGTTYSDHASFWQQGYPALLGIEQGVNENPWYHQDTDILSNYMEFFPFGTECAKAAIATVAVYADPLEEGVEEGQETEGFIQWTGPVPASSSLNVILAGDLQASLELFDASGRLVLSTQVQAGETEATMDVSSLPAGVYALRGTWADKADSRLIVIAR